MLMQDPIALDLHRSCDYSQSLILRSIYELHNGSNVFTLDPCFNRGTMYSDIVPLPEIKMDIKPIAPGVLKGDFTRMPFEDRTLQSVVADPPFIIGKDAIMSARYGSYKNLAELQVAYDALIRESARVLKRDGLLVIKCQDIIEDRRKYFTSMFCINTAINHGFNLIDEYIKINKSRPVHTSGSVQNASRSFHSKFLVFRFRRGRRRYFLTLPKDRQSPK